MAAHTDINRAHEVANEVRRIHKQLKEAQGLASTYNNRERLFNMPITNVSFLTPFICNFRESDMLGCRNRSVETMCRAHILYKVYIATKISIEDLQVDSVALKVILNLF